MNFRTCLSLGLALTVGVATLRAADEDLRKEVEQLRKDLDAMKNVRKDLDSMKGVKEELEQMKREKAASKAPIAAAQANIENKYGPNSNVTTKQGKLTIGGLVQVWYYSIQNDNIGFFGDRSGNPTSTNAIIGIGAFPAPVFGDTNEFADNDSFAIRRAQLRFTMDIHENVSAVVMIDPAREIGGRPSFPTNAGLFKTQVETGVAFGTFPNFNSGFVRDGEANFLVRSLLEDAYINFHGIVPHHDFTVGQHRKFLGEEGIRSDASLDFCERSMIAQTYESRDVGLTGHGTWWDDRFQYWLGVFNDPGNWFQSAGPQQNRVDDNDQKSFTWRFLVRPLWKNETWGSLELGASGEHSRHGEAGTGTATNGLFSAASVDGLNHQRTQANRYYAWASYRPGGPVKGWWLKGEWGWMQDRNAAGLVGIFWPSTAPVGPNPNALYVGNGGTQSSPNSTTLTGFNVATGYKISDSVFKDSAPGWLKNFEFAFRYEQFQNVMVADLINTNRTDVFATDVWTGGINYYIKGDNAKIQLNYNVVDNPDAGSTSNNLSLAPGNRARHFHAVKNDSLVVNFQVAW
ncbi:MAG: hypothetical protein HY291_03315 [Planctomycetes bacterium]|nr:hypothetical protein [Planctomycetota bacterium]